MKKILKGITAIMGAICLLSALSLDCGSWVPTITLCISLAWLALYGEATGFFNAGR